jgi:hypothetical protein
MEELLRRSNFSPNPFSDKLAMEKRRNTLLEARRMLSGSEHHRISGYRHRVPSHELRVDDSLCRAKMERIPETLQFPVIIKSCGAFTGEP